LDNKLALQGEHDQNGEEEGDQGDGADFGNKSPLVPLPSLGLESYDTGDDAGDERNTQ